MADNCPERMDAADAEAPMPPRIETAVEFCPRVAVESMETAGLTMRFFWRSKKKNKQKQEAAGEC